MSANDDRLAFAAEFSPTIVDLREVLSVVAAHSGEFELMREDIRQRYFAEHAEKHQDDPAKRFKVQQTLAYNVLRGMAGYGLIDDQSWNLTDLGERLLSTETDDELYESFAEHVLLNVKGLEVLEAIRTLDSRGIGVTKGSLHDQLVADGFDLPRATTHHTKLLQWLRKAEILPASGYQIDEARLEAIVGTVSDLRSEWARMPPHQRAFIETFQRLAATGKASLPAKAVFDETELEHGSAVFPRADRLKDDVIAPLVDSGWLTVEYVSAGRGGKSGTLTATSKLLEADLDLIATSARSLIPQAILDRLNTPLEDVLDDLKSSDTHTKGLALEILACRLAHDLTLTPVQFRLLSSRTGGAEVDLTADAVHLHHSRWLFQCKNTATVHVSALAKEVGMAVMLKAHVIVLVTTGSFAGSVAAFASQLMADGHLQVVLVDGEVLNDYRQGGSQTIQRYFRSQAKSVFRLKQTQLEDEAVESDDG